MGSLTADSQSVGALTKVGSEGRGLRRLTARSLKAALHDSEALSRSILEPSADCIKILSCEGTIQLMNPPGLCAMEPSSYTT